MASEAAQQLSPDSLSFVDIGNLFSAKLLSLLPNTTPVDWLWKGYTKTLYEEVLPFSFSILSASYTCTHGPRSLLQGYSTYHIVLEVVLFAALLKLLLTPRQRSKSEADKLSEKVCRLVVLRHTFMLLQSLCKPRAGFRVFGQTTRSVHHQEIDDLVAEFNPEPLVQKAVPSFYLQRPTLTGYAR